MKRLRKKKKKKKTIKRKKQVSSIEEALNVAASGKVWPFAGSPEFQSYSEFWALKATQDSREVIKPLINGVNTIKTLSWRNPSPPIASFLSLGNLRVPQEIASSLQVTMKTSSCR